MKKTLQPFNLFLAILLVALACGLSACESSTTPTQSSEVVLCNFEQYSPDFELLRPVSAFGAINVNQNQSYVKSGNASAKIQPLGSYYTSAKPSFYIPFMSNRFGYNYMNIKLLDTVSGFIYNAQEQDVDVYIGFTFNANGSSRSPYKVVTLKSGWNTFYLDVCADYLNTTYDLSQCYGFYMAFDNISHQLKTRDIEDAPVFYLDDVKLKLRTSEVTVNEDIIQLDPYEICGFEKLYQEYVVVQKATNGNFIGTSRIVTSAQSEVSPLNGTRMMELTATGSSAVTDNWMHFEFIEKLEQAVNYKQYASNVEDYAIKFGVYNTTQEAFRFTVDILYGEGNNVIHYPFVVAQGRWSEFSVALSEIYAVDNSNFEYGVRIRVWWPEFGGADKVFYFDDFRVAKTL